MWRPADEVCLCWGIALKNSLSSSRPLWGSSLSKLPNYFARAPAFAGFACLVVQGFQKSPWGVELTNRHSSSGPQVHARVEHISADDSGSRISFKEHGGVGSDAGMTHHPAVASWQITRCCNVRCISCSSAIAGRRFEGDAGSEADGLSPAQLHQLREASLNLHRSAGCARACGKVSMTRPGSRQQHRQCRTSCACARFMCFRVLNNARNSDLCSSKFTTAARYLRACFGLSLGSLR